MSLASFPRVVAVVVVVAGDLAWLVAGLIAAACDSESAVLSWPHCRLSP